MPRRVPVTTYVIWGWPSVSGRHTGHTLVNGEHPAPQFGQVHPVWPKYLGF